ncbi:MAG: hypothetical protein LBT26_01730 [Clostridiales Family XIII bacterium]|jgi:hypothetical protein|nr:hypothetical protein [Clostridiales Family XIII bacterium]
MEKQRDPKQAGQNQAGQNQADLNRTLALQKGEAPFRVHAQISRAGNDIQIYIGGGSAPHIGSVAVSQPRASLDGSGAISCTTSVHNLLGHKDDRLAVLFAEAFCREYACVAVAAAGFHMDRAHPSDVERVLTYAEELLEKALRQWGALSDQ